ncbi:Terminal organelle assembly protein [Trema orientale]|uniref:Terminal organelle assembly protein n=1 Tax=Trema orientale TaxID=63057 RepID=A0A2P5B1B7_TREOI|nr:Terminal organelle assembly protein [Trema orientale]
MKKTLEHRPARKDEELSSISSLANILQDILKLEIEGDKAIKSGKYTEAMKIFTGALSFCPESPHVVARFLCNRATALMALHEICNAIADCNVAIALDGEYCHALSIRATIHESIKDYQEAASDVRKLVCILEMRSSGSLGSSCSEELRDARKRMHRLEKEAKKGLTLDFYAILDVNQKASADDIKKSYHQAALIFHPDKAWNLLKILRNRGYKQQWNKISEDNKNGAEKIFKLLSQANSVLSDPVQRSEYDRKHNVKRARSSSKTRSRSSQF